MVWATDGVVKLKKINKMNVVTQSIWGAVLNRPVDGAGCTSVFAVHVETTAMNQSFV
jgi:hypothetical protein